MDCPNQHGEMKLKIVAREVAFRGGRSSTERSISFALNAALRPMI